MPNSDKTYLIVYEIAPPHTEAFTTRVQTRGERCFEICFDKCILQVTFERYDCLASVPAAGTHLKINVFERLSVVGVIGVSAS